LAISVENHQILRPCVFFATAEGVSLGIGYLGSEETRMMGLPDGRKSFKIGLAVLIQYQRLSSRQSATQAATHVAVSLRHAIKIILFSSDPCARKLSVKPA